MRAIQVTDTRLGKKVPLKTLESGKIRIYACGVTTYDDCHIGHAMQAIFWDVIRRYLEFAGYEVVYVRNYTDVDDKIIARAAERNMTPRELAEQIIAATDRDMANIGVREADYQPKVSETINEIIEMVQSLINQGAAYPTASGDVYYKVREKKDYGKLSHRNPDELRSGTRQLCGDEKQDPLDFALWKHDETPTASWDSPWGPGRPGWHIECSAMAKKFLGSSFDIHGGGRDLVFPHHENEIAQSESANGCDYASYWLHNGLLTINKQKMSKSTGNHITIAQFLNDWPHEVLRYAYLRHHYASNIDFNEDSFHECRKRLLYFYQTLAQLDEFAGSECPSQQGNPTIDTQAALEEFHTAMSDDFNTAAAIGSINRWMKKACELSHQKRTPARRKSAKDLVDYFRTVGQVLGIMENDPAAFISQLKLAILPELGITAAEIEKHITARKQAREAKNFTAADEIRNDLKDKGIELMDRVDRTEWTIRDLSQ